MNKGKDESPASPARRKIILGGAALTLFPVNLFGNLLQSVFDPSARDPFVNPLDKELAFESRAVEYFRKNYGEKAARLAAITLDAYRHGRNSDFPHDPLLHLAMIRQESGFGDTRFLISPVGAVGSAQVMPNIARKEPFNLKTVYEPQNYKTARAAHLKYTEPLNAAFRAVLSRIQQISENPEFKRLYSGVAAFRNEWGFVDEGVMPPDIRKKYRSAVAEAKKQFMQGSENIAGLVFDYISSLQQSADFGQKLDASYRLYEDELGSMVFRDYRKGDVRRLRVDFEKKLEPKVLRSEAELRRADERLVNELVVPPSYKEMQRLTTKFGGNKVLAVASYNAGEDRIRNAMLVPRFAETWDYISNVFYNYYSFRRDLGLK